MAQIIFPKKETDNGGKVEFKASTSLWKEALKSITAFANTEGGVVYFGIDDKGNVLNNEDFNDSTQKTLQNHFQQAIDPDVSYKMEIQENQEGKVLAIIVYESSAKTHTLKLKKQSGTGYYKRVGTVDQEFDKEALFQAQLKHYGLTNKDWSEQFCDLATLEDIDNEAIAYFKNKVLKVYASDRHKELKDKSDLEILEEFNLIENIEDKLKISNTCILLFGKKSSAGSLIGRHCRIKYKYSHTGKFDDTTTIGIAPDRGDWRPPFITSFEEISQKIQSHNHLLAESDLFRDKNLKQYEQITIRELMMNSFVHRDWSQDGFIEIEQTANSLQFENPGEYKNWNELLDLVLKPSQSKFYRNKLLAEFMFEIGLIEQEASGIVKKILIKQKQKGLSLPRFSKPDQNWTKVFLTSQVINEDFARLMLRNPDIELVDVVLLDKIIQGQNLVDQDISKEDRDRLKKLRLIELEGTRYQRAYLSKNLSKKLAKTGIYTKMKGLKKQQKIELILNHIDQFGQVKLSDLDELFPDMTKDQKTNLLIRQMCNKMKIIKRIKPGQNNKTWFYTKNDNG
jgi:ATP-dependent DNA helicase RecG